MIRWPGALVALLLLGAAALAQCPADRPIERAVMTSMATCTLPACTGPLICPDDNSKSCYRGPARDCNTCTPVIQTLCLSAEELAAAKQRK